MPLVFTYDLSGQEPADHNRIQSFFERFGWESLGGSSYRYPRLGTTDQPVEDWLNHVVPALMLFRSFALKPGSTVKRFTLDVQSSSGFHENFGNPPLPGAEVKLYHPNNEQFGKKNLIEWLDGVKFPY